VKNLLAQMNGRAGSAHFVKLLQQQADGLTGRQLIDYVHSLTSFCRMPLSSSSSDNISGGTAAAGGGGRRAGGGAWATIAAMRRHPPLPNQQQQYQLSSENGDYKNRFNERHSGLEGVIVAALFSRAVSKLAKDAPDFGLPENMV
jgi:hypothetical protein